MRPFDKKSDLVEINRWLLKRGKCRCLAIEDLSEVGLIEPSVAVGFLVQAECRTCFLEGYITNPEVETKVRYKAVKEITEALIEEAKRLKFKRVMALTSNKSLINHCYEQGFDLGNSVYTFAKDLT